MQTGIKTFNITDENRTVYKIMDILPEKYRRAYESLSGDEKKTLSEIRIRSEHPCSFTAGNRNIIIKDSYGKIIISNGEEISEILEKMCEGSVYSFSESIKEGYIPYKGTRIGVCGEGSMIDGTYTGQRQITSLSVRIPGQIACAADSMLEYIDRNGFENTMGVLAVSPPNCGKTTFLRALAKGLSDVSLLSAPRRICIIDERGELYSMGMMKNCLCDVLTGIPKVKALEMAVRTMSPQVVVFDEIGNSTEAELLCEAYSGGIYVAASVHGNGINDTAAGNSMRKMIAKGVFGTAFVMHKSAAYTPGEIVPLKNTGMFFRQ